MKSNKTVLHYTVQDGNISLLRYFLELNAFKSKDFVNNKVSQTTHGQGLRAHPRADETPRAVRELCCSGMLHGDRGVRSVGSHRNQLFSSHTHVFFWRERTRVCEYELFLSL